MCELPKDASFQERLRHDFRNMPYKLTMIYISVVTTLILLTLFLGWGGANACT